MNGERNLRQKIYGTAFSLQLFCAWVVFLSFAITDTALSSEIILGEKLKFEPELILREAYRDNVYLSETDEENDFITAALPGLDIQFAITPRARVNLTYSGLFQYYKDADNFREDHHYGIGNFEMEAAGGSSLEIGVWGEDSAIQPYSIDDRSKDYYIGALYADGNLKIFTAIELFATIQHSIRRFDEEIDTEDDYDRDSAAVGLVYSRSSLFPVLLEYRYERQENDKALPEGTDFNFQAGYTGFKWGEGRRLSGTLRVGYLWSEFNGSDAYDGWVTDTQLRYNISPAINLRLRAERGVRESTRTARDTLDYFIFAGGGLAFEWRPIDALRFFLFGNYQNRDYRSAEITTADREDDFYLAGITAQYDLKDWLSFSLGYLHRNNDSTIGTLDYGENRVYLEIILFSSGKIRDRRISRSVNQIRYF